MKLKIIIPVLLLLFLFAGCRGNGEQSKNDDTQQAEAVDTNKIYEVWEVDEPPVIP